MCVCVPVHVCVLGRSSTHRTHLAGELILKVLLEIVLFKQLFEKSFASEPSSQRDHQVMWMNPHKGSIKAKNDVSEALQNEMSLQLVVRMLLKSSSPHSPSLSNFPLLNLI